MIGILRLIAEKLTTDVGTVFVDATPVRCKMAARHVPWLV